MDQLSCYIDGTWSAGGGSVLRSVSPVDGSVVWEAAEADAADVARAVAAARAAQPAWELVPLAEREAILIRFAELVDAEAEDLAAAITNETGKPRWEAATEVASVVGKVRLSIDANHERTPDHVAVNETASLTHRPLGVIGVLGPFNFPAHLPNGQIVPALLAGNAVVYKPSELTPAVAAIHARLLAEAGVPPGVVNLVIGSRDAGEALVAKAAEGLVDGIAFTGSVATGRAIHRALADRPEVLLALEMGGNNPLVVADDPDLDVAAAANLIVRSAFITAGQRCTCARRLYLPTSATGDAVLKALVDLTDGLVVGGPDDNQEPFIGPVISAAAASRIRNHVDSLVGEGATLLTEPSREVAGTGFVRPAVLVCDGVEVADDEVFGPVLTVHRYSNAEEGYAMAAATRYGLVAGLIGGTEADFDRYRQTLRVGLVNWNAPTTGASGRLPFGGVGASGNHRPAGWTAADFCAYPVASVANRSPDDGVAAIPGST